MIPPDVESWKAEATREGINQLALSQISVFQRFSGSTISFKSFLQLRAIWSPCSSPDEAVHALRRAGFIPKDANNAPCPVVGRSPPRLEDCSLCAFLTQVATSWNDRTPVAQSALSSQSDKRERELGIFATSLTLWRQLRPVQSAARQATANTDANPSGKQPPISTEPPPKLDLHRRMPDFQPSRELLPAFFDDFAKLYRETLDTSSVPDSPSRAPLSKLPKTSGPLVAQISENMPASLSIYSEPCTPDAEADSDPEAAIANSTESIPAAVNNPRFSSSGRTAYEVQTTCFFVPFFHTLFNYRLSISWSHHIDVAASERQYKFGTSLFTACPDGAFSSRSSTPPKPFLHFELKPYLRMKGQDVICCEETAEIVAILSQELADTKARDKTRLDELMSEDNLHFRLMVSLDREEYYITVVSFTSHYLRYINDLSNVPLPSTLSKEISKDDMISFEPYGPFRISDREHMFDFCNIMTAVVAEKTRESPLGAAMIDGLCAAH